MPFPSPLPIMIKTISGGFFFTLGLIAILAPQISALPVDLVIGWLLLAYGIGHILLAFYKNGIPFAFALITGIFSAIAGWLAITGLFAQFLPVVAVIALSLLIEGTLRLILSVRSLPDSAPSIFIISAITTITIAIYFGFNGLNLSTNVFCVAVGLSIATYGLLHLLSVAFSLYEKRAMVAQPAEEVS